MKAAILVELNKPLVIADVEAPPPGTGQVLVRVTVSGLCGSQIGEIEGAKGPDKYLPHLLGHEACGIVQETGSGVTRVRKGDKVVMHWRKAPGLDSPPPVYRWGNRTVNAGGVTTFSEMAVVSENRLTPVPQDTDDEVAALMGCAVTTAFGVINNDARLKIGQSIAIFGVGGVGAAEVQAAALVAGNPIIAVDIYDHKLELAGKIGATHVIDSKTRDAVEEIRKIVGPGGVDVAIDNTGNPKVIEAAYEATSARGRTILVGVPHRGNKALLYTLPLHFEKVLKGSHGGDAQPADDIPRYLALWKKGKPDFGALVSHRFRLDGINDAVEAVRSGAAVRCLLNISR